MAINTLLIELVVSDTVKEVFTSNEQTVADLIEIGFKVNILSKL